VNFVDVIPMNSRLPARGGKRNQMRISASPIEVNFCVSLVYPAIMIWAQCGLVQGKGEDLPCSRRSVTSVWSFAHGTFGVSTLDKAGMEAGRSENLPTGTSKFDREVASVHLYSVVA
jgi:hypothetical protein